MTKLRTFFIPEQVTTAHVGPPSLRKIPKVVKSALDAGLIEIDDEFGLVPRTELYGAHTEEYAEGVIGLRLSNGFGNRDSDIRIQCLASCGSIRASARYAVEHNTITFSPTQGFHHAGYRGGWGYCTFNGLIIAAKYLLDHDLVEHVTILDGDTHYGDGTENIIEELGLEAQINHIHLGGDSALAKAPWDVAPIVGDIVDRIAGSGTGLVIYQAGADSHIDDDYGGGFLTTEQFHLRDRLIFRGLVGKVPLTFNLAGGYNERNVVRLHTGTVKEAFDALNAG